MNRAANLCLNGPPAKEEVEGEITQNSRARPLKENAGSKPNLETNTHT